MEYKNWKKIERCILNDKNYSDEKFIKEIDNHKITIQVGTELYRARNIDKNNDDKLNSLVYEETFCGFPASECGASPPEKVN